MLFLCRNTLSMTNFLSFLPCKWKKSLVLTEATGTFQELIDGLSLLWITADTLFMTLQHQQLSLPLPSHFSNPCNRRDFTPLKQNVGRVKATASWQTLPMLNTCSDTYRESRSCFCTPSSLEWLNKKKRFYVTTTEPKCGIFVWAGPSFETGAEKKKKKTAAKETSVWLEWSFG